MVKPIVKCYQMVIKDGNYICSLHAREKLGKPNTDVFTFSLHRLSSARLSSADKIMFYMYQTKF